MEFRNKVREIRRSSVASDIKSTELRFANRSTRLSHLLEKYPSPLQFYRNPPTNEIGLSEFETLAHERVQLLQIVERFSNAERKFTQEWVSDLEKEIHASVEPYSMRSLTFSNAASEDEIFRTLNCRERDHLSHYILRLGFCRDEESRRWIIQLECDLFKARCLSSNFYVQDFLEKHEMNMRYQQVNSEDGTKGNLYKVHFTEVLDLVRLRKVRIEKGFCFVPEDELVSLFLFLHRKVMQHGFAQTSKSLENWGNDERIDGTLRNLRCRSQQGQQFGDAQAGEDVSCENVYEFARQGKFPLCMSTLQDSLNDQHHLKYKARIQYGLFLKGIGLSMENAIRFFRAEFTKGPVDVDKFDKEYTYGIRYNYGKEGKKVDWTPYNCMKIINDSPSPGEQHGCPYRHQDAANLKAILSKKKNLTTENVDEIMKLAAEGQFQKACAVEYKFRHKREVSTGAFIQHPNQYFKESHDPPKMGQSSSVGQNANIKTERVNVYSQ